MADAYDTLTEKEKETLRLMVRGHDAKSAAAELDLSVHTINERLRAVRRKLEVTSSREAARLLLESEGGAYENLADKELGDAGAQQSVDDDRATAGRPVRRPIIAGVLIMLTLAAVLVLAATSATHEPPVDTPPEKVARDHANEDAARAWLALTDANDWEASYAASASQFRDLNTLDVWMKASQEARAPLGAVLSREAIGYRDVHAPPHGYSEVQFRTDFATRKGVIETVTLEREGDDLRVVAYIID